MALRRGQTARSQSLNRLWGPAWERRCEGWFGLDSCGCWRPHCCRRVTTSRHRFSQRPPMCRRRSPRPGPPRFRQLLSQLKSLQLLRRLFQRRQRPCRTLLQRCETSRSITTTVLAGPVRHLCRFGTILHTRQVRQRVGTRVGASCDLHGEVGRRDPPVGCGYIRLSHP